MRRRPVLIGLVAAIVIAAAYSVFWWVVAGKIEAGVAVWAQAARAQGITVSWQKLQVGGYPFAFRIELTGARLRDDALSPAPALAAPLLSASTAPWNFRDWAVSAPVGLDAALGPAGDPLAKLAAGTAAGTVAIGGSGEVAIWLELDDAKAAASGIGAAVEEAQIWLGVPATPPGTYRERNIAVAADLRLLSLPLGLPPLGATIADVAFGATLMGPIPPGAPRQTATAWRDGGGTIELDHLHLSWNALAVDASGTLALDQDLQPIGSFSGAVAGYDVLLAALASAGQIRGNDARLARLALGMIARPGPYGRPQIATSITLQNGAVFLGPARLGPMPRIPW